MNFKEAILDLDKHFELRQITQDVYEIKTPYMINSTDAMFIVAKDIEGETYITDYGTIYDYVKLSMEDVENICVKHNMSLKNGKIMCKYTNYVDVKKIILCIDDILGANEN